MLEPTLLWALLTGGITGGAWGTIVVVRRRNRSAARQRELLDDARRRLARLEDVDHRVGEIEERMDGTERRLRRDGEIQR
jgi:type VI protein secretion system component VasK